MHIFNYTSICNILIFWSSHINNNNNIKGNFSIDKHLKFIDNYISKYEPIKVDEIKNVKPWTSPRKVHMMCPPDPSKYYTSYIV